MPLSSEQFKHLFGTFQESAFRLQLLPNYDTEGEREDYARFLAGQPLPERAGNSWLKLMAAQVAKGRKWTNVHLLPEQLTPYLRYLIDWWYVYHDRAGAQLRFLSSQYAAEIHALASQDFWLFDDRVLIHMRYGPKCEFLGVDDASLTEEISRARQARDFALSHSEDLRAILARRRAGDLI